MRGWTGLGSEGGNKEEIFYMFYVSLNVNVRKICPDPASQPGGQREKDKYWQQQPDTDTQFLGHRGRGTGDRVTVGHH